MAQKGKSAGRSEKKAKSPAGARKPVNKRVAKGPKKTASAARRTRVRRIGILTGGGDCPGLNAVIRAVVKTAIGKYGVDCHGIEDGYRGLIYRRAQQLTIADVSGILHLGGTILGSSNKDNPFAHRMNINGAEQTVDLSGDCIEFIHQMAWDCLVCIGGDGTLTMAHQLAKKGINVVAVPKTIDNDLSATDYTFGFWTAVQTAVEALDRLHTTAMSHHRVLVVEMMGRYTGHLALEAGIAGGGDIILIPEIPFDMDHICEVCVRRSRTGKRFSMIVVAEGAMPIGGQLTVARTVKDAPDTVRLGGIAHVIADQICRRTSLEARATVLGHLQRGGSPIAYDRILSTRYGYAAAELVMKGKFGTMVALQGDAIVDVPLDKAIHKLKQVSLDNNPLMEAARAIGTDFGVPAK